MTEQEQKDADLAAAKLAAVDAATKQAEDETVTLPKAQVDELVKAAEDASALAAKKSKDAENYQKGMLKYKSKLKENGIEDVEESKPGLSEERVVELMKTTLQEILPTINKPAPENDPLEIANKKISEMKLVIANSRNKGGAPSGAGSNLDKPEVKTDGYWSPEQLADLKAKGLNPDVVRKNMENAGKFSAKVTK